MWSDLPAMALGRIAAGLSSYRQFRHDQVEEPRVIVRPEEQGVSGIGPGLCTRISRQTPFDPSMIFHVFIRRVADDTW